MNDVAMPLSILLVEDNPGDERLVRLMIEEHAGDKMRLFVAGRIADAARVLERERIDIVLLDLRLPDGSGLDSLIKIHALAPNVPVVVLSHVDDEALAVKAVRMGAQDFLLKSHINGALLVRALRYALERRQIEERLHHLAHHDSLTGLPNRKFFYDNLSRAMAAARRHRRPLALMLIDLDNFKEVNDNYGHQVGDALLREVAHRIQSCLRVSDCVARLGGDEFIVFVSDLAEAREDARRVAEKILATLEAPCLADSRALKVQASLGIALFPEDSDDLEELVRHADDAMYRAKEERQPSSQYRFYARESDTVAAARFATEEALRDALQREEFVVHYQPQIDLHSGRLIGLEALLRWRRNEEIVPPADFIHVLEHGGLIIPVGYWVIREVCRQIKEWRTAGLATVKVAINLSARQLRDRELVEQVARALRDHDLEPAALEFELPETALRDDEEEILDTLRQLNALGTRLALDNFSARTITLSDLKRFPIHAVKLDSNIVRGMADNAENAMIAQAIIAIAHVFKMKGLAEGVESLQQTALLREQACDDAQGFAIGRPLSAEMAAQILKSADRTLVH